MTSAGTTMIRLRWLQLRRAFPGYGLVMLALAACLVPWLVRAMVADDASMRQYIGGGMLLSLVVLHQRRGDLEFVHKHVDGWRRAMALEYVALVLPVGVGLLMAGAWRTCGALVIATSLLPWLPVAHTSLVHARWLRRRLASDLYAWRAALQQTHPWSMLLWLLALGLCWLPVLPLMLLGALVLMACSAQERCEPRSMLLASGASPRTLLRRQVGGAVAIMSLVLLPVLIGATIFQPDWWWVHLGFGLGQLTLVAYAVVLKYANYMPNERLSANGANVATAAVLSILPGLFVAPLVMLLSERRKALDNLNAYFHDHDR